MTPGLNKHFTSQTAEIKRSQIIPAPYNPRIMAAQGKAALKRGIKKYGVIGGMVWNKRTSYLVSGHQKLAILDEINKYDNSADTDYTLKVEVIDVDEKTERELNILFNNPNAQGEWDYDKLRDIIPDIDYKDAGLTESDLAAIGIEIDMPEIANIAGDIADLQKPYEQRKAEVKAAKQHIKDQAEEKAQEHFSHVTLSFDNYAGKSAFMLRFGFQPIDTIIKGESFAEMIERID